MPTNHWRYRVDLKDVWRDNDRSFEGRRDEIVRRLKESGWYKAREEGSWLHTLVEELSEAYDTPYFDHVFNGIYDEADADCCWIATF